MNAILDVRLLRRLLTWGAVVLPAAAVGAAFVVRGWPTQRFLAFYVAPLFLAAPLWVRVRLGESGLALDERSAIDGVVLLFSLLRFVFGEILPFSGHMLFLVYSALTAGDRGYRMLAYGLLVETTVFKLWLWRDLRSWSIGLALGLIASGYVRIRSSRPAI